MHLSSTDKIPNGKSKRKKNILRSRYYKFSGTSLSFQPFCRKEIKAKSFVVLQIVWGDTNLPKKFPEVSKDFKGRIPPKRNYTRILFTGDEKTDKIKLGSAQMKIREILSTNDSLSGINFEFGDSAQYWTFVKSIDILRTEGANNYMLLNNHLWFYHFPPDTTTVNWICGTTYSDVVCEKPKVNWWTKTTKCTYDIWRSSWQIILLFAGFLISILILKTHGNG